MITKRYLAEQLLEQRAQGVFSVGEGFGLFDAMAAIDNARDYYIKGDQFKRRSGNDPDRDLPDYIMKDYEVVIARDKNKLYTPLPARPLDMIDDLGIYEVSFVDDESLDVSYFVPMPAGMRALQQDLVSGALQGRIGFFYRGPSMYFVNMPLEMVGKSITITMIPASKDIDMNEPYLIHPDWELDILRLAKESLTPQFNNKVNPSDNVAN